MRTLDGFMKRVPSFRLAAPAGVLPLLLGLGCGDAPSGEPVGAVAEANNPAPSGWSAPTIDPIRSLEVTDLPTLEAVDGQGKLRFSLERTLAQIAASSGTGATGAQIYQRMFDTNNTKAGGFVPDGQHCDDVKDADGHPVLNGFPIECPRQEGALADLTAHNPFCTGDHCDPYTPIAIVNRFDLADAGGQTCGQYRIVYGKGVGQTPLATAGNQDIFNRNLVIFEAIVPNPHPRQHLAGCAPIVAFWAGLSKVNDPAKRAEALDRFYFKGLPGFEPVVAFQHYTGAVDPSTGVQLSGQIRANQFMFELGAQPWQLREYNLDRRCTGSGVHKTCGAVVKMVPPKLNPDATLFDDNNQSPAATAFRDPGNPLGFLGQVASLATGDLNLLNMNNLDTRYNTGQSTSSPVFPSFPGGPEIPVSQDANYMNYFNPRGPFAAKIQAKLDQIGSHLTPLHIVRRAQTQACAGCHELSSTTAGFFGGSPPSSVSGLSEANKLGGGLTWPDPAFGLVPMNAFTQTSEQILVPLADGVTCDAACAAHPTTCQCAWSISPALSDIFLPFRRDNMITFLSRVYSHPGGWNNNPDPAPARMCGNPDN